MTQQLHSHDAEVAVLAAAIRSRLAYQGAQRHLTGADFYEPWHEQVWDMIGKLYRADRPVETTTLNLLMPAGSRAQASLVEIDHSPASPDAMDNYASDVRGWATRRRVHTEAARTSQRSLDPNTPAATIAVNAASAFAAIRDAGTITEDVTAMTAAELIAEADGEPEWLIPGLMERRDRLMLTGEEGLAKSTWLRQLAVLACAGLHPLDHNSRIEPLRALIYDCENTKAQVRRKIRPLIEFGARWGEDPAIRVMVDCVDRIDISQDRDLARIHHVMDALQPDIVVIGPLYRLVPRALQTDDETAPVLAALDTIRSRGAALLIEAHAGHALGKGGVRDMRPRGSSSLMGWPEFGFGLRGIGTEGYVDVVQWRGPREEREWPSRMRRADSLRWLPHGETYGWQERQA